MHKKKFGAAAVLLSLVIIAACFTPSENASDESLETLFLADETVIISPECIDEESSVIEIILSYERASAEKKYYESKGLFVEFHNPLEFKEGTFKGDLIGVMESEIRSPPPQDKCTDSSLNSVREIIPPDCRTGYPALYFGGIDLEFLKEVIKFVESRTDRVENCLMELTDALQKQQEILLNVESLSACCSILYADSRSVENRYRQSADDQSCPVYVQENDSEKDLPVYDYTVIFLNSVMAMPFAAEPIQTDSFNF